MSFVLQLAKRSIFLPPISHVATAKCWHSGEDCAVTNFQY